MLKNIDEIVNSMTKGKSRPFQVQSFAMTSNVNENYKVDIKDITKAPYLIGYKLDKMKGISKICGMCQDKEHFTVQCSKYRRLKEDKRRKVIFEKKIISPLRPHNIP